MEFWKKENSDRLEINSPTLTQRYGLKISHHPCLTHMTLAYEGVKLMMLDNFLEKKSGRLAI